MIDYHDFNEQTRNLQLMLVAHCACLINTGWPIIIMENIRGSCCQREKVRGRRKKKRLKQYTQEQSMSFCSYSQISLFQVSSIRALSTCPLLGPEGAFWYAPCLLARLYFFIRPSGGCQSPTGCQSTLILIRTWVLSGVNGSQHLSTGLSQSYCSSYITLCMHACMYTLIGNVK